MSRKTVKATTVAPKQSKPDVLSNGMENTWESWREFVRLAYGDNSAAVAYVDLKIAEQGEKASPDMPENSVKLLLRTIEVNPELLDRIKLLEAEASA